MTTNICNCKHAEYCKVKKEDKYKCKANNDPWTVPDNKIFGRDPKEINKMQGRNKNLK